MYFFKKQKSKYLHILHILYNDRHLNQYSADYLTGPEPGYFMFCFTTRPNMGTP